jgi:predicted ATP-grasp superfamily ATP-dependent carboligase
VVLLTGGRAPVALDAARNFKRAGYDVYVAESFKDHMCKVSNCVKKSFLVHVPRFNETAFVEDLIRIIEDYKVDLIIPTCEETFYLSKHKLEIEARTHVVIYTDYIEKMKELHHKGAFVEKLRTLNLPFPETITVTEINETTTKLLSDKFANTKVVAKPAYSRFGSKVEILRPGDSLNHLQASDSNPLLFQKFVEGIQICVYATCINGNITSLTQYRSSFNAGLGASLHFERVNDKNIETICQTLLREMSYTGQVSFDFIVEDSGRCFAIECNPRATSGLHLLMRQNFLKDFIIMSENMPKAVSGSNCMLVLPLLTIGLQKVKTLKQLKNYWHVLRTSQDVIFSRHDPLPFLYQLKSFISFLRIAKREGISVTEATTYDIEWNGE